MANEDSTPPESGETPDPVLAPASTKEREKTSDRASSAPEPVADSASPASRPPRPKRVITVYGVIASVILVLLWILPITYVGAAKKDVTFLPLWLRHQQRISCLFINHAGAWADYYTEIQKDGEGEWVELSDSGYFEMPVFGYRSRLHRILGHSYKKGRGARRINGAARFIKTRYERLNPKSRLNAIRFVRGTKTSADLARQTGCYKKPFLSTYTPRELKYFGETRWDGKRAEHAGNGTERKPRKKRTPRKGRGRSPSQRGASNRQATSTVASAPPQSTAAASAVPSTVSAPVSAAIPTSSSAPTSPTAKESK